MEILHIAVLQQRCETFGVPRSWSNVMKHVSLFRSAVFF